MIFKQARMLRRFADANVKAVADAVDDVRPLLLQPQVLEHALDFIGVERGDHAARVRRGGSSGRRVDRR